MAFSALARLNSGIDNFGDSIKRAAARGAMFSRYGGNLVGGSNYGLGGNGAWGGDRWGALPGAGYDYRAAAGPLWKNPAAAACLLAITDAFAQSRLQLEQRSGDNWAVVSQHELSDLLTTPNNSYSPKHLWGLTLVAEHGVAAGFWRIVRDRAGRPAEVWFVPPVGVALEGMGILWDAENFISGYAYWVDGKPNPMDKEDVLYFRRALSIENPRLPYDLLGLGSREVATLNGAATYTGALLRNGATPSGFLTLDGNLDASRELPTNEQAAQMKQQIKRGFTGENVGEPFVSSLPWRWTNAGFSPEQLALDKIQSWPQEVVCALLRTPSVVALLPSGQNHQTYENVDAFTRWWWDNTIIPLEEAHSDEIEAQLFPQYNLDTKDWRLSWDRSRVPALREDEDAKVERVTKLFTGQIIDLKKANELMGYEANDDMKGVYFAQRGGVQPEQLDPTLRVQPRGAQPQGGGGPVPPQLAGKAALNGAGHTHTMNTDSQPLGQPAATKTEPDAEPAYDINSVEELGLTLAQVEADHPTLAPFLRAKTVNKPKGKE